MAYRTYANFCSSDVTLPAVLSCTVYVACLAGTILRNSWCKIIHPQGIKMRISILIICLLTPLSALAGTYKWVDENGITHYGDTLPPQAVNRGTTEMDKRGLIRKKVDATLTPEQMQAKQLELAKQRDADKQKEEARRHDQALMGTYTAEQEIDLARDRNIQQIEGTIARANERITNAQSIEKDYSSQLARFKDKAGTTKTPPKELVTNYEAIKKEKAALANAIIELQKQKQSVTIRFSEDKARFRELKGGVAVGSRAAKNSKIERTTVPFEINDTTRGVINNCLSLWSPINSNTSRNYAISGELAQSDGKTELMLDGRIENKAKQLMPQRVVCPLTADGKVDEIGVETKKILASLGVRY